MGKVGGARWLHRARWVWLVMAVLLFGSLGWTVEQAPLVRALGLAHAQVQQEAGPPILVLDHLPTADAPTLQAFFSGEIWGRHAHRRGATLLPFLALMAVFAVVVQRLALGLGRWGRRLWTPGSVTAWPSLGMACALVFGGWATATGAGGRPEAIFWSGAPWAVGALLVAALGLGGQASSRFTTRVVEAMQVARWFWLGVLIFSPHGWFGSVVEPPWVSLSRSLALVALVVALAGLEQPSGTVDPEAAARVAPAFGSAQLLPRQELVLLVPLWAMGEAVGSLRAQAVLLYLLASLTTVGLAWGLGSRQLPSGEPRTDQGRRPPWGALAWLGLLLVAAGLWQASEAARAPQATLLEAQRRLGTHFGHRARLVVEPAQALVLGCQLDVAQLSLAREVVSDALPGLEVRSVEVRGRRWERVARVSVAATVVLLLLTPTYLLTVAPPGPCPAVVQLGLACLGGLHGAFAWLAVLGWFWLDPRPHGAAFVLCVGLLWLARGTLREWVDHQLSVAGSATPSNLVSAYSSEGREGALH